MRFLRGMNGLGDTFYQRAVLRKLGGRVVLQTSWPQLFTDMPQVKCVRSVTALRTQSKNIKRGDLQWHGLAAEAPWQRIGYNGKGGESMLQSMLRSVGAHTLPGPVDFSGPPVSPWVLERPYIVVRPATLRQEWLAAGRNPHPGYLAAMTARLGARFRVVVVADIHDPDEWAVEPPPVGDENYLHGELQIEQLLSLVAGAAGVVGGVGWLLPAALAYKTPMLVLYGGWGAINGPRHTLDPRIDSSCLVHAMPDNFCLCTDKDHACDKTISPQLWNLCYEQFTQLIDSRQTRLAA